MHPFFCPARLPGQPSAAKPAALGPPACLPLACSPHALALPSLRIRGQKDFRSFSSFGVANLKGFVGLKKKNVKGKQRNGLGLAKDKHNQSCCPCLDSKRSAFA